MSDVRPWCAHRSSPGRQMASLPLAGADADELADVGHPDLAVADLVGAGRLDDGVDDAVDLARRRRRSPA